MGAISERPRTMWELFQCLREGTPVQLINNQLDMSPAPKDNHQQAVSDLFVELTNFVRKNKLGKTRVGPSDVYLNEENIYQPDIYFVSNQNLSGFREDGFHGAPDLTIEILSPGTEKLDKVDKMKVHEVGGVKEYWIVDPETKKATGYFNSGGHFDFLCEETNKISSKLLNTVLVF